MQSHLNIFRWFRSSTSIQKFENCMEKPKDDKPDSYDLSHMRKPYNTNREVMLESGLSHKEPISLFQEWFQEACNTPQVLEANAMCLATCSKNGIPSARYVLLKGFGKDGFIFFSNYNSRKGKELEENSRASSVFYWESLKKSIRIEGDVFKVSRNESEEYFHSRPVVSQLSASASPQSTVIKSRDELVQRVNTVKDMYCDKVVPCPTHWGGYKIVPHTMEFWQGQSDRLHDRIRFRLPRADEEIDGESKHLGGDGWIYERLAP